MEPEDGWIQCLRPDPTAAGRLLCFPFAGAGAHSYLPFGHGLPGAEVLAVQLPGRGVRINEPPCLRLDEVVPLLARATEPYLDRPLILYGHSMGARLAFEVVRHLMLNGCPLPAGLVVSGAPAPHMYSGEDLHCLAEEDLVSRLCDTDSDLAELLAHEEMRQLLLPVLRADLTLIETAGYRPAKPLPVPVYAFHGDRDPIVTASEMAGWADHATAGFALRIFPGDHFFIRHNCDLVLPVLADVLRLLLSQRGGFGLRRLGGGREPVV